MLILITGGSGSGKSQYAEDVTVSLGKRRCYLATMFPFDEECRKKIERHRIMRKEKGFDTVECYQGIETLTLDYDTVLLECMSNLLANEMYGEKRTEGSVSDYILEGIRTLSKQVENLIVVSNEVFSDGIEYDEETMKYISFLGEINRGIGNMADKVIEVVYSIPVIHKTGKSLVVC